MPLGRRIEVTPGFCILWALLLLVLPLRLLMATAAAAGLHELCHWAAIGLLGGQVRRLRIGAGGMVMETGPMPPRQELVCALAGPVGSLLLVPLYGRFPCLALCGLVQGCFNLLPLYPLDGGRVMSCILELLIPRCRERILRWIEWGVLALLLAAALGLRMGCGPILVWGMLAMRKIPCKDSRFGVQ